VATGGSVSGVTSADPQQRWISPRGQIAFQAIDAMTAVHVLGRHHWDDAEWDSYIAALVEAARQPVEQRADGDRLAAHVVYLSSVSPTTRQRRVLAETTQALVGRKLRSRSAVLSSSGLSRVALNSLNVIVRALNVTHEVRAWDPAALRSGLDWLGRSAPDEGRVIATSLSELMATVGYDAAACAVIVAAAGP
jgi:hypothetical protein